MDRATEAGIGVGFETDLVKGDGCLGDRKGDPNGAFADCAAGSARPRSNGMMTSSPNLSVCSLICLIRSNSASSGGTLCGRQRESGYDRVRVWICQVLTNNRSPPHRHESDWVRREVLIRPSLASEKRGFVSVDGRPKRHHLRPPEAVAVAYIERSDTG